MHKVIIVDDEAPALNYIQVIIAKHIPGFEITARFFNGEDALNYLGENNVDLMVTDVKMPGMDGITLANQVRLLYPDIHIVIVSGHSDFEYAMGAIKASVDGYVLKPIDIKNVTEILRTVEMKISSNIERHKNTLLPLIACRQAYDTASAARIFNDTRYLFALVRWGNLPVPQQATKLSNTFVIGNTGWYAVLQGRDEDEQIIITEDKGNASVFKDALCSYTELKQDVGTWTVVYSNAGEAIYKLNVFISGAVSALEQIIVVGEHKTLSVSDNIKIAEQCKIAFDTLRELDFFVNNANKRMIKDILLSLANEWDRRKIPQIHVLRMIQQIADRAFNASAVLYNIQELVMKEIYQIYGHATSYVDIITGLCSILFDESRSNERLSSKDLYDYATTYIKDNYAKPISVQSLCQAIGISRAYLSRLFKSCGDTTFNAFLTKCRIDAAMLLIQKHPDTLLRDVAACVGYEDPLYFSKVFSRITGINPTQYAENITKI